MRSSNRPAEGVTLAASLVQEDAPERFWNPSECFTELYLKTRREPLTQATLKNLQRATALLPKPAGVATGCAANPDRFQRASRCL